MEKLDLEAIRRRIDKIDAQLVAALEERMEAVLEVAAYKKQQGLPVLDAAREAQVLSKACMRLQHKEYAPDDDDHHGAEQGFGACTAGRAASSAAGGGHGGWLFWNAGVLQSSGFGEIFCRTAYKQTSLCFV